jgi:hypothetical protein
VDVEQSIGTRFGICRNAAYWILAMFKKGNNITTTEFSTSTWWRSSQESQVDGLTPVKKVGFL